MKVGTKIKNFKSEMTGKIQFNLSDYKGQNLVIYFYPRDNTPGCTSEGEDFRDHYKSFLKKKTKIFGVSKDSIKSHEAFKQKFKFPFELISDPDEKVCKLFDVIKEKSMYGKKYMGVERSTFLIDSNGKLLKEWRKVRNSSGKTEFRPVIKTKLLIGKHKINTELTLTQRSKMTYDMLIGRIAIKKRFIIELINYYNHFLRVLRYLILRFRFLRQPLKM